MLEAAAPSHLGLIEALIRSGAAEGSWDPELAAPGPSADALFAKLAYALAHGRLPQIDPRTGSSIVTCIAGWVYRSDPASAPVGFGLFKDFCGDGVELWLCALATTARGKGLGRQMLGELLGTPLGLHAQLARCALCSAGGQRCAHILKSLDFALCRRTSHEDWLLHRRTPAPVTRLIATMDMSPFEPRAH